MCVNAGRWRPYRSFAPMVSAPLFGGLCVPHLPSRAEGRPRCTLFAPRHQHGPSGPRGPGKIDPGPTESMGCTCNGVRRDPAPYGTRFFGEAHCKANVPSVRSGPSGL
jgi:hypothetical protein